MRRRSGGRWMPRAVSVRTVPESCTSPSSGGRSPASISTSVVLPLPERPKRAITPGVGALKAACSSKSGRRFLSATRSIFRASGWPAEPAPDAPHQKLSREQPREPQREGQDRKTQRHRIAIGRLHGGVEGERQGARDAGNVGGKGDDGAELSESRGEGGHRPGEDPRQHEG